MKKKIQLKMEVFLGKSIGLWIFYYGKNSIFYLKINKMRWKMSKVCFEYTQHFKLKFWQQSSKLNQQKLRFHLKFNLILSKNRNLCVQLTTPCYLGTVYKRRQLKTGFQCLTFVISFTLVYLPEPWRILWIFDRNCS